MIAARRAIAFAALASAAGCGPKPPPAAPATLQPRETIVLAADPNDGSVGRLQVSKGSSSVDLSRANESTSAVRGGAPEPPRVMADDDVRRTFADALAALPDPPRQFQFYFELGGDALTPESKTLVQEVLAVVKTRAVPEVSVAGHTDTTGTAANNVQLGLKRAALIRNFLVTAGVNPALVQVTSYGETNQLVETRDNVAEPRNRRVEVSIR